MYIPRQYQQTDPGAMLAFMRANSFATLVSVLEGVPYATHLPVVVKETQAGLTISGHVARANPHWQVFEQGQSLLIFSGPHAYISPSLYEKRENVPTWNYIAVHAYGTPRILTLEAARAGVEAMLEEMFAAFEASYRQQWDELTEKYRLGMMNGIVGFEMTVERLEGKSKLSQNKTESEQERIREWLLSSPDPAAVATGQAMPGKDAK